VVLPRVLDVAREARGSIETARDFSLHLHELGLGTERADVLDFVCV